LPHVTSVRRLVPLLQPCIATPLPSDVTHFQLIEWLISRASVSETAPAELSTTYRAEDWPNCSLHSQDLPGVRGRRLGKPSYLTDMTCRKSAFMHEQNKTTWHSYQYWNEVRNSTSRVAVHSTLALTCSVLITTFNRKCFTFSQTDDSPSSEQYGEESKLKRKQHRVLAACNYSVIQRFRLHGSEPRTPPDNSVGLS
jgi:hypothetical protein